MTTYIRADTEIRRALESMGDMYVTHGDGRATETSMILAQRWLRDVFSPTFATMEPDARQIVLDVHGLIVARHRNGDEAFNLIVAENAFTLLDDQITRRWAIPGTDAYLAIAMSNERLGRTVPPGYVRSRGPQAAVNGMWFISGMLGRIREQNSASNVDTAGVEIADYNGWRVVRPVDMDSIPRGMREYVTHTYNPPRRTNGATFDHDPATGVSTLVEDSQDPLAQAMAGLGFSNLADLMLRARSDYREWLTSRRGNLMQEQIVEFERKRREHAAASAARFESFRESNMSQDQLIPTLPFVPHGLAASRRWGIEVESGGARGVQAPKSWTRKRDGSLRSAWEGHTEVQDFEPFDEEVTSNIEWYDCDRSDTHVQYVETWDAVQGRYVHSESPEFVDPSNCEHCGERTRIVRREPQTITHRRQDDDCAEFVSPILTSMHSNGLEKLVAELALQPQNDTAGVHVHVESDDLTDEQIATLVYGYDQIERFIESSYQRGRREYARRQPADRVLRAARDLKRGKVDDWVRSADRYLTVNVQALSAHGTIEFRAMGPVYNYDHLIRWAMFCREMVNVVKGGATYKEFGRIKKWGDLLAIFAKYGKEYTRAAVYELTGETGEAAKLSKENARMTAAALNADLESVILGLENMRSTLTSAQPNLTEAFRAMAAAHAALPNVTAIRRTIQPNLVSVAALDSI